MYTYRTPHKELVYAARIESSEFIFLNSIRIGAHKIKLEKILKSRLNSDLIKIGDMEGLAYFTFIFENDILTSIDYNSYMD